MTADGFQIKTKNGYPLMEVISALQKEIRRGKEFEALYWAFELLPNFEFYFWRRLKVIINEDVGIADPKNFLYVEALQKQYFEMRSRGDLSAVLPVANIILIICRSPKTRVADDMVVVMMERIAHNKIHLEIPDYAVDKHTARGRGMKRGWEHWKKEGKRIENEAKDVPNPYTKEAEGYLTDKNFKPFPFKSWGKLGKKRPVEENGLLFEDEE